MSGTVPVTRIPESFSASSTICLSGDRPTTATVHPGRFLRIKGRISRIKYCMPSTFGSQSIDPTKIRSATASLNGGLRKYSMSTPGGTTDTRCAPNHSFISSASAFDTAITWRAARQLLRS